METLDIEKQSIVLLTSYFKKPGKDDVSPLTPGEWKLFAEWLRDRRYTPGSLLSEDGENIIESWNNEKITRERLIALLKRGAQMSVVLEKWSRAGIWILTRSDSDYPQKLKKRLGQLSPPILFGAGNKKLLNLDGIAVVGSRNISDEEIKYSEEIGKLISEKGLALISGGAKGADETAMLGALTSNGNSVGVLADGLFQKSISITYRKYLSQDSLVFISPNYPDAGFSVGNAMARNKYIYCLSEAAIVVQSGLKGGTWTGANENLKKRWVPLYVKENDDRDSGNNILIKSGGIKLKDNLQIINLIDSLINEKPVVPIDHNNVTVNEPYPDSYSIVKEKSIARSDESPLKEASTKSFFDFFIIKLTALLKEKEMNQKDLKNKIDLNSTQLKEWLNRAETEGIIKKSSKPIKYKLTNLDDKRSNLFNQ